MKKYVIAGVLVWNCSPPWPTSVSCMCPIKAAPLRCPILYRSRLDHVRAGFDRDLVPSIRQATWDRFRNRQADDRHAGSADRVRTGTSRLRIFDMVRDLAPAGLPDPVARKLKN